MSTSLAHVDLCAPTKIRSVRTRHGAEFCKETTDYHPEPLLDVEVKEHPNLSCTFKIYVIFTAPSGVELKIELGEIAGADFSGATIVSRENQESSPQRIRVAHILLQVCSFSIYRKDESIFFAMKSERGKVHLTVDVCKHKGWEEVFYLTSENREEGHKTAQKQLLTSK